jgi:predicted MFS family arabinose efflux permease
MQSPLATIAFDVAPETKGLPSALIGLGLFGGGGLGSAFYGYLLQLWGYGAIWFAAALGSLILIFIVTQVDLDFGVGPLNIQDN